MMYIILCINEDLPNGKFKIIYRNMKKIVLI